MPARTLTSSIETGSSATRKLGVDHQRAGQHDALQLAAGELVRQAVEIALRSARCDEAQALGDALHVLGAGDAGIDQRLGQRCAGR